MVDADPLPVDGETVSHESLPDAFQFPPWQFAGNPLIVTDCEPAEEPGLTEVGLIV